MKAVVSTVMGKLSSPLRNATLSDQMKTPLKEPTVIKKKEMAVNRAVFDAVKRLLFYMTIEKF